MRSPFDLVLDTLGFARFVLRRWSEDHCPQIAGNLTYTTLLAIAPTFAVAVALMSSTPAFVEAMGRIEATPSRTWRRRWRATW